MADVLEGLREYAPSELFSMFGTTEYYPAFYVLHVAYVCFNLRWTARTGFSFYRSFALAWAMATGPRVLFAGLIDRRLVDFGDPGGALLTFSAVWLAFNVCPFDLTFKFARRPVVSCVLQLLDACSQGQGLAQTCFVAVTVLEGQALRVITISSFCALAPLAADVLDRLVVGQRNWPMAHQFAYAKRVFVATVAMVMLYTVAIGGAVASPVSVGTGASAAFVVLAAIDNAVMREPFRAVDIVFPDFWSDVATFWPARAAAVDMRVK